MKNKILGIVAVVVLIIAATMPALGSITQQGVSQRNAPSPLANLLLWLFEQFPNAFPVLKYILITNGFLAGAVKEGTGSLVMKITDAPPELNISEALVTISEVRVHYAGTNGTNGSEGSWITIVNSSQTFDLIQLQNATDFLGEATLAAGWYTQIRLSVDSALVTIDGVQYDLEIPSHKIKLITPFLVQDNETLELTLDFDVQKSVHETGSGKYVMRPTIKVIQEGVPGEFEADAGGDYEADVDETIQFNGSAWGGVEPYSWSWDFGDGSTSTLQNPQHAYTLEGEYEVTLVVTDAGNQTATDHTEAKIGEDE